MAATQAVKKINVSVKVNDGTTESGKVKTVSSPLPHLAKNSFDADKVMNVVSALEPCLKSSVVSVEKTEVDVLTLE